MTLPDVAKALGVHASAVYRWAGAPWWAAEVMRAKAELHRDLATLRLAVHHEALRQAHEAMQSGTADAALLRVALGATAPVGAEKLAQAKAELLGRLEPDLRARVALALGDADEAALAELPDAELERIARGGGR